MHLPSPRPLACVAAIFLPLALRAQTAAPDSVPVKSLGIVTITGSQPTSLPTQIHRDDGGPVSTTPIDTATRRFDMTPLQTTIKRAACAVLFTLASLTGAHAHGGRAGDIEITHPYATPTPPGAVNGAAYVATLTNTGAQPDRLLRVGTPIAQRAELHSMTVDAGGVMRMRELAEMPLAPGASVKMRPGDGLHFMLIGLKQPLKEGDSFPLTLEFERGGKAEVRVIVQVPKARGDEMGEHKH